MNKKKSNFYSLENIIKEHADYNVIYGERSNGKTFACLERAINQYAIYGKQAAYIRRYDTDFKGKRGATLCDGVVSEGVVTKATGGEWDRVYYYSGRWFFAKADSKGKIIKDIEPFMYAFALSTMEHDKSTSYPGVSMIIFDEFLSRSGEIYDEFNLFLNTLSTIIRQRADVQIFMLGNTVNKESEYFEKMGLREIVRKLEKGQLTTITTRKGLKIAIEYSDTPVKTKPSDKYYDFETSTSRMIIGGDWEIDSYPHAPCKHSKKDVYFTYYICFRDYILTADMIYKDGHRYTFVYPHKGPIKDPDRDYIFSDQYDPRTNWHRRLDFDSDKMSKPIYYDLKSGNMFFKDDETGEVLRNYLLFCQAQKNSVI